jgi:Pyruvate/2-oxoacid:ferredoxin oxidoreductase delta subunit
MIETIDLERCTGCGNCDAVCPADVIHMERMAAATPMPGVAEQRWLPAIRFREHCITCYNCEIFCPERIVDVHPSVKNRPLAW